MQSKLFKTATSIVFTKIIVESKSKLYVTFDSIFWTLQKLTATFLMIVLHAQPMAKGIVVMDFLLNKPYIKEFLCINKEKPKLVCNGKCYLMKQLKKTQNEKEKDFPILQSSTWEFILTPFQEVQLNLQLFIGEKVFVCYNSSYIFHFEKDIFHPPIV